MPTAAAATAAADRLMVPVSYKVLGFVEHKQHRGIIRVGSAAAVANTPAFVIAVRVLMLL